MPVTSYGLFSAARRGSAMLTVTAGMARPAGTRGEEGAAGVRMTRGLLTLSRDHGHVNYALEQSIISLQYIIAFNVFMFHFSVKRITSQLFLCIRFLYFRLKTIQWLDLEYKVTKRNKPLRYWFNSKIIPKKIHKLFSQENPLSSVFWIGLI